MVAVIPRGPRVWSQAIQEPNAPASALTENRPSVSLRLWVARYTMRHIRLFADSVLLPYSAKPDAQDLRVPTQKGLRASLTGGFSIQENES
jgi:hypothetical protein